MAKKTWNKKDILPDINSREYNLLLENLEKNVKFIELFRDKLKPEISADDFMLIIKAEEKISELISRLTDYAYLWFSEDTSDQQAKKFRATAEQLSVNVCNRIMFFNLWFKSLDDKNTSRIINEVPKDYKYYLEYIRILKPYTLSEPEEKLINLKDVTGGNALIKLYDTITNGFVFNLKTDGRKKELTRDELTSYVKDTRADVRKAAYQEMYNVYSKHSDVLNEIYRNVVLDWKNENVDLRKYKEPISPRNISNDVSAKAIETLLNVCRKNRFLFQEYFKLKARLCKIKNMKRYDIYTSYKEKKKKFSYAESQKLVFDAYKQYSGKMHELARKIVEANHVDYETRKNKMGGAYCMYIAPGVVPYVLLNHNDHMRDVFTIAHEFGHGVHDLLADNHSILTAHPPLVLAETASVFGEMLLFDKLIKETKDREIKKSLLIQKLDDTYATVIRQAYFILFEIKAHEMINKGTDLDSLNKAYLENLKEQFGNSLTVPDEFKYEWTSIPHIYHSPFYCYAYTFGNLLVLALYEKYKKEGKSFVPKYLKILSYGGSENPGKILKEIGIDIEDEKFWQSGFDLIKEIVGELRRIS